MISKIIKFSFSNNALVAFSSAHWISVTSSYTCAWLHMEIECGYNYITCVTKILPRFHNTLTSFISARKVHTILSIEIIIVTHSPLLIISFYFYPRGHGDESCNLIGSHRGADFPLPAHGHSNARVMWAWKRSTKTKWFERKKKK